MIVLYCKYSLFFVAHAVCLFTPRVCSKCTAGHDNLHDDKRQRQEVDGVIISPKVSADARRQAVDIGVQNVLRQALSGKQTTPTLVDALESYTYSPAGSMEYAVNRSLAEMFYQAHSGRARASVLTKAGRQTWEKEVSFCHSHHMQ